MEKLGWICPICKSGVNPEEKTCPNTHDEHEWHGRTLSIPQKDFTSGSWMDGDKWLEGNNPWGDWEIPEYTERNKKLREAVEDGTDAAITG